MDERIRSATASGGLIQVFQGFDEKNGDWHCVESGNPFTRLYLDLQYFITIPPNGLDLVQRNYDVLSKFWNDKVIEAFTGSTQTQLEDKFGREFEDFPRRVHEAYDSLCTKEKLKAQIKKANEERLDEGKGKILGVMDVVVSDGVLDLSEAAALIRKGIDACLSEREAATVVLAWLECHQYRTLVSFPKHSTPEEKLKYEWLCPEKYELAIERIRTGGPGPTPEEARRAVLESLSLVVRDGEFVPYAAGMLVEVGRKQGLSEEDTALIVVGYLEANGYRAPPKLRPNLTPREKLEYRWLSPSNYRRATARRLVIAAVGLAAVALLAVVLWPTNKARDKSPPSPPSIVKLVTNSDSIRLGDSIKIRAEASGFDAGSRQFRWQTEMGKIKGSGGEVWLDTAGIHKIQVPELCVVTVEVLDRFGHSARSETAVRITIQPPPPSVRISSVSESFRRNESVKITAKIQGFDVGSQELLWETDAGKIMGRGTEVELSPAGVSSDVSFVNVTLEVRDKLDHSARDAIRIKLLPELLLPPPNRAPIVQEFSPHSAEVTFGGTVDFSVTATDPDGDTLEYLWNSSLGKIQGDGPRAKLLTDGITMSTESVSVQVSVTVKDDRGGKTTVDPAQVLIRKPRPKTGTIVWQGNIRGSEMVDIDIDKASSGHLVGGLPGVPCIIRSVEPRTVRLIIVPSSENHYSKLRLLVIGNGPTQVVLTWISQ